MRFAVGLPHPIALARMSCVQFSLHAGRLAAVLNCAASPAGFWPAPAHPCMRCRSSASSYPDLCTRSGPCTNLPCSCTRFGLCKNLISRISPWHHHRRTPCSSSRRQTIRQRRLPKRCLSILQYSWLCSSLVVTSGFGIDTCCRHALLNADRAHYENGDSRNKFQRPGCNELQPGVDFPIPRIACLLHRSGCRSGRQRGLLFVADLALMPAVVLDK